jgi:hypothetical protein
VLKYAERTGKIAKNVAAEIKRDEDLPSPTERERRYLTHAELSKLAKASDRFETLTLILGYCGLRSAVCGLRSAVCGSARRPHSAGSICRTPPEAYRGAGANNHGIGHGCGRPRRCRERHEDEADPPRAGTRTGLGPPQGRAAQRSQRARVPLAAGGHLPLGEYRWAFDNACEAVGINGLVPRLEAHHGVTRHLGRG